MDYKDFSWEKFKEYVRDSELWKRITKLSFVSKEWLHFPVEQRRYWVNIQYGIDNITVYEIKSLDEKPIIWINEQIMESLK
jgi:hypothetical protein